MNDKPKEFWIKPEDEIYEDDCIWFERPSTTEAIHVIEYRAYEEAQKDIAELERLNKDFVGQYEETEFWRSKCGQLQLDIDRLKGEK